MLTESWTPPDIQAPDIPGYTCFSSSRNFKHALAWRASGGVACYVKDAIASRFKLWRVSSPESILWLRSKEKLTWVSGAFHLHIGLVYVPPHGSSSEEQSTVELYEVPQQDLAGVLADNGVALVAGDVNARAGSASGTCMADFSDLCDTSLQPDGQLHKHLKSRTSDDLTLVHLERLCWICVRCLTYAS